MERLFIRIIEGYSDQITVYGIIDETSICSWTWNWWFIVSPNQITEWHTIHTNNCKKIFNKLRLTTYPLLLRFQWAGRGFFPLSIRIVSMLFSDVISIMCTIHLGNENYPWYYFDDWELWYPPEILFPMHERFKFIDPSSTKITPPPVVGWQPQSLDILSISSEIIVYKSPYMPIGLP